MQKIIHIVDRLSLGGVSIFIKDLAIRQKNNYKVSILTLEDNRNDDLAPVKTILDNGIEIIRLNQHKYSPLNIFKLIPYLKQNDIVHVHLFPALYWVSLAKIFYRHKKLFFTEHIFESNRRKKILIPFERFIYKRYSKIIGVSEPTAKSLTNWFSYDSNIIYIYNGVETNTKDIKINEEIKSKYKDKKLLIMAARIGHPKNQTTLIKAFSHLPNNYHLLLAGDGPQVDEMKTLCKQLNIQDNISFLGRRSDVLSLFKTCDISILSTYAEGFGLGVMESLSVGTPCLASDIEVLRNIIQNDNLLFQVEDDKELAKKIRQTLENKTINQELIEYGNKLVQNYSIDKMVKRYSEVYNS